MIHVVDVCLLATLAFLACVEKLCSIMNLVSVERDWVFTHNYINVDLILIWFDRWWLLPEKIMEASGVRNDIFAFRT